MNFEEFIHPGCEERFHKGAQRGFEVLSRLSQPYCPNVLVWRSAGTSIWWEQICECHTCGNACHCHPRSFSFCLHPGSLKISELLQSHQPARWRRLNHSLLLWFLFLYKFIEFCLMQRTILHKSSRAGRPACAVRGFHARPTAQRLFDLLPADLVIAAFACGCSNK